MRNGVAGRAVAQPLQLEGLSFQSEPPPVMHSLFIQLSLLVASLASVNLIQAGQPVFFSVAAGILAGCTLCFFLLLGDYSVHKYLEEKKGRLTSVHFDHEIHVADVMDEKVLEEESTTSVREALAA